MNLQPAHLTAAQLAAALGMSKRAVLARLDASAAGVVKVNGQEARAWNVSALPEAWRAHGEESARRDGYRNLEAKLNAPPAPPWQPRDEQGSPIPLAAIAQHCLDRAARDQRGFASALNRLEDLSLSAEHRERLGVDYYARITGRRISPRHWRALLKRIMDRDAGAGAWHRIDLYLPERLALKKAPAQRDVSASQAGEFAALESYLAALIHPQKPTEMEERGIWTLAFEHTDWIVGQGATRKQAARRVRDYLAARAPFLAASRDASRDALLKAFDRKLARWLESARDAKALRDGRAGNGDRFEFPGEDRDLLIHRAVFKYRGDIAPAWRDCLRGEFSAPVLQRYRGQAADKSHVPTRIREDIAPEVEILTVMHQGPRAFDAIKGHVTRSYDGIASLQCYSADDLTAPVYSYVPDGSGWFHLVRGQVLMFICFRTWRVLGWSFKPLPNYSSIDIRSLCTHVFAEFGVPEVLAFERGCWESAALLKGKTDPFSFAEISQGLREFGIKFIHSIRPRSKPIERVFGILQDAMESEPGYCGREERKDAPEALRKQMAEIEARKVHPSRYLYSFDQWNTRIGEIVAEYNATPQQGHVLAGLSPDAGFEKFMDADNPPMQFPAGLRYLLAHDKRQARVTLNGITIQVGKQRFNYRGAEIAHLVGREVLAWVDFESPDILVVTNPDRSNPICVGRSENPNALESLIEPEAGTLGRELERIGGQASHLKARFNVLKAKFTLPARQLLANAQTAEAVEMGRNIDAGKSAIRTKAAERVRDTARAARMQRKIGLAVTPELARNITSDDARALSDFLDVAEAAPDGNPGESE